MRKFLIPFIVSLTINILIILISLSHVYYKYRTNRDNYNQLFIKHLDSWHYVVDCGNEKIKSKNVDFVEFDKNGNGGIAITLTDGNIIHRNIYKCDVDVSFDIPFDH